MGAKCCEIKFKKMSASPFAFVIDNETPCPLTAKDDQFFALALKNARFCLGSTHPNPSVGAVLFRDDQVVAQGYTHPVGGLHAERHAISNARGHTDGTTLYVSLEPCSHFGRTPPCTNAIIDAGIRRVIYGVTDPNPVVSGSGIKALQDAGIDVSRIDNAQLMGAADALITPFKTWVLQKRPYVVVKLATSSDSKIAAQPGVRTKISGALADVVIHRLRRAVDAIMVGANTVRIDNPELTARFYDQNHQKQPTRVILSTDLKLDERCSVFDTDIARTMVITDRALVHQAKYKFIKGDVEVIGCGLCDGLIDLDEALTTLASKGMTSILMEAGAILFDYCVKARLANEIWWFKAQAPLGPKGLDSACSLEAMSERGYRTLEHHQIGDDELTIFGKTP